MIIDLILDRKDSEEYNARDFYYACLHYGEVGDDITRALDSGTEKDVKKALCDYVIDNDYNKNICKYINSVNWLDDDYYESKKYVKKSLKEKLKDNGDVEFNDVYSCDLVNVLTVKVFDKELYEKLREKDLVLYKEGVYEQINWKSFQDEISYLIDDIYASEDFNVRLALYEGTLLVYVRDNKDDDTIMMYKLKPNFVN